MKALILNGASGNGAESVLSSLRRVLENRAWTCREFGPGRMDIRPCTGCFSCWWKSPGICAQRDDAEIILQEYVSSRLLVLVSPIRWGSYSAQIKKTIERMIPVLLPSFEGVQGETRHPMRYPTQPKMLAIGLSADPSGPESKIFRRLVNRNALNLRPPEWTVCILDPNAPQTHEAQIHAHLEKIGVRTR